MDTVSIRITRPEYSALREIAKKEGRSLTWLITYAVKMYLKEHKNGAK
ncbi:ribbon-helix-helix protein, CopG family [Scandinavium sp.]